MLFRDCNAELVALPPNTGMQRTARCARKIAAILKAGIGPLAFAI
jgi:hypothetical protein